MRTEFSILTIWDWNISELLTGDQSSSYISFHLPPENWIEDMWAILLTQTQLFSALNSHLDGYIKISNFSVALYDRISIYFCIYLVHGHIILFLFLAVVGCENMKWPQFPQFCFFFPADKDRWTNAKTDDQVRLYHELMSLCYEQEIQIA